MPLRHLSRSCSQLCGRLWPLFVVGIALLPAPLCAQLDFEREPIRYQDAPLKDPISCIQPELDAGDATLEFDPQHGYLPAVLKMLGISESSQTLVFSKTSFQLTKIDPQRPRAVYFNDETYVGWVQNGDVVEVATVDPNQGAQFYTLRQEASLRPRFVRDKGQCLSCHASSRTQGVPGFLVRSVFTSPSGQPHFGSGTFTTDDRSPFDERWGGWYVTGRHGQMRHMGNVLSLDRNQPEDLDRELGANVNKLDAFCDTRPYLRPTSDIVALMVLEHQTQMHNAMTLANYTARSAAYQDRIVNQALERPIDFQSESTQRRIASAGNNLVERMLFCREFEVTSPVEGDDDFVRDFQAAGPWDSEDRSLRQFDLNTRLFRYPCSFLIYSASFDALPDPMAQYVAARLDEILCGKDTSPQFAHLTLEDRQSIREILVQTKPQLCKQWSHEDVGR